MLLESCFHSNTCFQTIFLLYSQEKMIIFGLMALMFIVTTPLAFSTTLGDDWKSIKSSLSDGEKSLSINESLLHVNTAHSTYINSFKNAALVVDPESDTLIENAFDDIQTNYNSEDIEMVSLNRQVIDKTIYKIAYMKMQLSVDQDNVEDFLSWYTVLDKKFKVSEKDYESNTWVSQLKSDSSLLSSNGTFILEEMLTIFKLKTIEELEEAIAALDVDNVKNAKKFTFEGLYYYRTLHPSVQEKLGIEAADELLHEMEESIEVTTSDLSVSEMKSKLEHIFTEVELIIREYEGGDTSEIGLALSGIKDRLNLVENEYHDAVKDGKIIDQTEYDETVVFLTKAIDIFNAVKPSLINLSESDTNTLENNLIEINTIVVAKGKTSEVSILVGKSLNNVISLEEFAGGAVQIDIFQYFDKIDQLLNDAKTSYRNGNTQLAFDLVSEAYLDNYEFIEGPLGEIDPDLMVKIELDLREDLRNMIKSNVTPDEIDLQIDMILIDLTSAKKVVPEFGTIAAMILAVAIISIITISAKSRLNILPRY